MDSDSDLNDLITKLYNYFKQGRKVWTKSAYARTKTGKPVHWDSNETVRRCLAGEMRYLRPKYMPAQKFRDLLTSKIGVDPVTFNDYYGYKAVIDFLTSEMKERNLPL